MGKLVETLAFAGSQKPDGTPNASGKVWAYVKGTTTQSVLYADVNNSVVLTQPVVLDGGGRAVIYVHQICTLHIETAAGVTLGDVDVADDPAVMLVQNLAFTGTLPDGSQGPGGATDLDTILSRAGVSFGGPDWTYAAQPGATPRPISAWMSEVHLSIKDFGAVGDGHVDDTAAIQATVNRAIAMGGATVYFPPGTYIISATITNASAVAVSFVGAGNVSLIRNVSNTTGAIAITGSLYFQMSSLSIDHPTGTTATALTIADCKTFYLFDLTIQRHLCGIDTRAGTTFHDNFQIVRCLIRTTSGAGARPIKTGGSAFSSSILGCWLIGNSLEPDIELVGTGPTAQFGGGFTITVVDMQWGILLTSVNTSANGTICIFSNHFAVATLHDRIAVTGTVPRLYQWANGVDILRFGGIAAGFVTPDWFRGPVWEIIGVAAGPLTISNTAIPTLDQQPLRLRFKNQAGVPVTWAFGTQYRLATPILATDLSYTELSLVWDAAAGTWNEVARGVHL